MIISMIVGTDYRYDSKYRFYGWEYADEIRPLLDCGASTLGGLYLACLKAWSMETCSAAFRGDWSPDNPSVGQCTITAHIVHELFGGEVLGLPLIGGGLHSFNLIDGHIVDLASEQFGKDALLDYAKSVIVDPAVMLAGADKAERRALLRKRLDDILRA